MPSWARAIPSAIYIVIVVTAFNFIKDTQGRRFTRLNEIIRIPGIYYLVLLIAWLSTVMISAIQRAIDKRANESLTNKESEVRNGSGRPSRPSVLKQILVLSGVLFTYVISVFLSWIFEHIDWKIDLMELSLIYCFSFTVISAVVGSFLLSMIIPMKKPTSHQDHVQTDSSTKL